MELWTAFLLGLVGSVHCAGMCGPLALALPVTGDSFSGHLAGRAAYNGGRIITYAVLGVVFGLVGKSLMLAGVQRWVSIGLGVSLISGLFASRRIAISRPVIMLLENLKRRMGGLLRRRSVLSLGGLGLLNGLLPCGLVYVAAAAATATGGVIPAVEYMTAFGLGTVPMMLAISLSGKLVPFSVRLKLLKAIPVSVAVVATLLILRGMSLGIPYISPDLSAGSGSCCHP